MYRLINVVCFLSSISVAQASTCTKEQFTKFLGKYEKNSSSCNGIYGLDYCKNGWSIDTDKYIIDGVVKISSTKPLSLNITLNAVTKIAASKDYRTFTFKADDKSVECTEQDGISAITFKSTKQKVTLTKDGTNVDFKQELKVMHEGKEKSVTLSAGLFTPTK